MNYDTINDAVTRAGGAGALLANRYRIVRQLGQGGMGSVWLAEDTQLDNKPFAIKMLPAILVSNKRAYRQLKDEALVAMQLVHPNIVQIRAFEENNGNPFLVMDYIDGQTLDDYLADYGNRVEHVDRVDGIGGARRPAEPVGSRVPRDRDGRARSPSGPPGGLPESDVLRILRPIAAALDYAHGEGVVHRDVKPANVMIRKDGHPFILDFGIAREIQETMTRVTGKLSSGTLLYMSPEQLNGDPPKPAQDVYSFAAMVYECLKGEPPFVRGQIEHQILNNPPPPLDLPTAGPSARGSGTLAASVMAGLAKKPEDRPATCAAVLEENNLAQRRREAEAQSGRARSPSAPYGWTKYDERGKTREVQQEEERARIEKAAEERIARLKAEKKKVEAEKRIAEAEREKRDKELAEERARIEKAAEERIARLKAEKEKVEAEKRKIEAEREKREKELAEERARLEKARDASVKQETVTELTLAEQEARQKEVARLAELRVDIGIKCDDAKEKMGRLAAYRGEPDGFKAHIDNADANWKIVEAVERNPSTVQEAEKSLNSVTAAENAIAKELHWLSTNKAARDGAKATEAEIARVIDPELKRFKADDYARVAFAAGDSLRKEGNAALANGDFPAAKKNLDAAKAKLSEAAANAKAFCIDTHLNTAKKWIAASKWQQCVEECDVVLGWDTANAEAKKLKAEAEGHLVPTARVVATIDGREVPGAKLNDGKNNYTVPVYWRLENGKKYGPYSVSYENGGKRYLGTFEAVVANWQGERLFTVTLKKYIRPKHSTSVPGKDDLDSLLDDLELESSGTSAVKSVPASAAKTASARPMVQLWAGGPYWATTNIGADKPGDYGYYFWWGDTVGYKRVNDAWVASNGSRSGFVFSESNTPTYGKDSSQLRAEGWITTEGFLAPKHDAAHVQWGGGWRMPTKQELDDLSSKCDWKWTTVNGVKGYEIHGKGAYASARIFLPCAGVGNGTSLRYAGSYGYYWSSLPDSDYYYGAWYLNFYSSNHSTTYYCRFGGQSVRPVQGFTK